MRRSDGFEGHAHPVPGAAQIITGALHGIVLSFGVALGSQSVAYQLAWGGFGPRLAAFEASFRMPLTASAPRSEEHTSELQSLRHLVCRLLLEKKKMRPTYTALT